MSRILVYTDGGSRGNPGPAAVGVVIYQKMNPQDKFTKLHAFGKTIGVATNNVAEYRAVVEAWKWLLEQDKLLHETSEIDFKLDSFVVANQLNGRYRMKSPNLSEYLYSVRELQQKVKQKVTYSFIVRLENMESDYWVNKALDEQK